MPRLLPLSGAPGDEGVMEAFDQEQPGSAWMLRSPGYGVGREGAYSSFPHSGGDRGGSFNIEVGAKHRSRVHGQLSCFPAAHFGTSCSCPLGLTSLDGKIARRARPEA